jgi:glycosyltransferase involved in cell wall biosynthesis
MFRKQSPRPRRIAVVHPEISGWAAGERHIRTLAHSLAGTCRNEATEVWLFCQHDRATCRCRELPTTMLRIARARHLPGEARLRRLLGLPDNPQLVSAAREHGISVLLPLRFPFRTSSVKTIGWIPDFQHAVRPEFFSEAERTGRDVVFHRLARWSTLVLVSSQSALEHFRRYIPAYAHKARLSPFPSLFAFEPPVGDVAATVRKFNLPEKFVLVANQFWRHKNHEIVIDAIRLLRERGVRIPVVMTGLPLDYRDPNNETTSRILQAVARGGIHDCVWILGMVDEPDFGNLMRAAALVVQPSTFEGWNAVIQDCKTFGRPLMCSDIPTHREQAPDAIGFFACDRPRELADLLAAAWPRLDAGPDLETEKRAMAAEQQFAARHGQALLEICREAEAA